jgi:YbbR domain-containing protein
MDNDNNIKFKRLAALVLKLSGLFFQNVKERFHERIFVFVFFVLLSTLIWLLKTLNKENYETTISYPVRYVNFPNDKVLVSELPEKLTLTISGKGYTLLNYKVRPKLRGISFDVNSFSLNRINDNSDEFFTLTRYAKENLNNSFFKREIEIDDIKPDTLRFLFSDKTQKRLAIKPQAVVSLQNTYMLSGEIEVIPDTVVVYGPAAVLDTMHTILTEAEEFIHLDDTLVTRIALKKYRFVSYDKNEVEIKIPVDKFTTSSITVPIMVRNVPDSLNVKIFPSEVKVNYKVALSKYEYIKARDFKAFVNFNEAESNLSARMKIELHLRDSNLVENPVLSKSSVEYLIEK